MRPGRESGPVLGPVNSRPISIAIGHLYRANRRIPSAIDFRALAGLLLAPTNFILGKFPLEGERYFHRPSSTATVTLLVLSQKNLYKISRTRGPTSLPVHLTVPSSATAAAPRITAAPGYPKPRPQPPLSLSAVHPLFPSTNSAALIGPFTSLHSLCRII